jgi:hypothetical protein
MAEGTNPCADMGDGMSLSQAATTFCTLPGDVDFDGAVTFGDFLVFSHNFGKQDSVWPDGDFDWDRRVGFPDFLMLVKNFGESLVAADSAQVVPEPGCIAMLLPLFAVGARLRRSRHPG